MSGALRTPLEYTNFLSVTRCIPAAAPGTSSHSWCIEETDKVPLHYSTYVKGAIVLGVRTFCSRSANASCWFATDMRVHSGSFFSIDVSTIEVMKP
jgi:hypothetical protein